MAEIHTETNVMRFDEDYAAKIMAIYDSLGRAEQRAAQYILDNRDLCAHLSIKELATRSECSTASIVRLCKDLGYSGFAELKFQIQQNVSDFPKDNLSISPNDTTATLKQKILQFAQHSINTTIQNIDDAELDRAATALSTASRVLFCAMGSACGAALAGVNHLLSSGIDASFQMDDLLMMRAVSRFTPKDVVIGINYDGYAKSVGDAMMIAKSRGATTILITSTENSLVGKYADIILYTPKRNTNNSLNYSTTTICQLLIVHLLIVSVWQKIGSRLNEESATLRNYTNLKRYADNVKEIHVKKVHQ